MKEKKLQNFLSKLNKVKHTQNNQYQACCPAHNDDVASLSISVNQQKINFYCHAGCKGEDILNQIGLTWDDIYFNYNKRQSKIIAEYIYANENGKPIHKTIKEEGKKFKQQEYINGQWNWGLNNVKPILYNKPGVIDAKKKGNVIFLVEGEKDADNLIKLGLVATCNPMGAGKWKEHYTETLAGGKIIIIPDNDKPGYSHAQVSFNHLFILFPN